jgi:endothelin-converting enzyme/putative endopeptidase
VYAKLGDENQRFLWGALEDAAKPRKDRSAVEQKIGDYFAACMNKSAVEKAGVGPIQPSLDAIAKLGSVAELPELLGREHQVARGSGLLFDWSASQDFADSEQVIAFASAGGLGRSRSLAEGRARHWAAVRAPRRAAGVM